MLSPDLSERAWSTLNVVFFRAYDPDWEEQPMATKPDALALTELRARGLLDASNALTEAGRIAFEQVLWRNGDPWVADAGASK